MMKKLASRSGALLALVSIAGAASNNTCDGWWLSGATIEPTIAAAFDNREISLR